MIHGTVSAALKMTGGPEAQKTEEFIGMVDNFWLPECHKFLSRKKIEFKDPCLKHPQQLTADGDVFTIIKYSGLKTNSWRILVQVGV